MKIKLYSDLYLEPLKKGGANLKVGATAIIEEEIEKAYHQGFYEGLQVKEGKVLNGKSREKGNKIKALRDAGYTYGQIMKALNIKYPETVRNALKVRTKKYLASQKPI